MVMKRPTAKVPESKPMGKGKRRRRSKAQMEEARAAEDAPEVKESSSILDVLGDEVTIRIHCEVKSSVEFQSVGTSAALQTNVPKEKLAEAEDKIRDYLRTRVLDEHRRLDMARRNGFEE